MLDQRNRTKTHSHTHIEKLPENEEEVKHLQLLFLLILQNGLNFSKNGKIQLEKKNETQNYFDIINKNST